MWRGILGHDEIAEQFRQTLRAGRLASTYLFVGPEGIGKKRFALELARFLLCLQAADEAIQACGECESCRLFAAGTHPDLEVVSLPADKTQLSIELFVGDEEHRNQAGMCHWISLKPFLGGRRVAIIDDADRFNASSANCLLKTLEEPPPHSLLILIGTSAARQLPTIRSRAQIVRFQPLGTDEVKQILLESGSVAEDEEAERLAVLSEGSIDRAVTLADPAQVEFRSTLLQALSTTRLDGVRLARAVQAFVDDAGKEASLKRARLRTSIGFAIGHYRAILRQETGNVPQSGTAGGQGAPLDAFNRFGVSEAIVERLDACLDALEQVDRNANLGLVIQNWCEELGGSATKT